MILTTRAESPHIPFTERKEKRKRSWLQGYTGIRPSVRQLGLFIVQVRLCQSLVFDEKAQVRLSSKASKLFFSIQIIETHVSSIGTLANLDDIKYRIPLTWRPDMSPRSPMQPGRAPNCWTVPKNIHEIRNKTTYPENERWKRKEKSTQPEGRVH
eukprot:943713-Pelagomonas_calceolata.AAC.2